MAWRILLCRLVVLGASACAGMAAQAARRPQPDPIEISIGGGSVESAAFRFSTALADVLSRPPGLPDCESGGACGIPGVIAGAQTFDDPATLLDALAAGSITTAVMPALRLYRARCGSPATPAAAVRALKILYRQPLQILVRSGGAVSSPADLARKPIAIGEAGSDSEAVALAFLDAYGLTKSKIRLLRLPPGKIVAAVGNGSASAGFILGHAVDSAIAAQISHGFTLLALPDGPERQRLLQALQVFEADAIPATAYPGLPYVSTISQPVHWVVGSGLDQALAEQLVTAESEPHNLSRIAELVAPFAPVPAGEAFFRLAIPPADGAAKFARDAHLPLSTLDCPATGH